MLTVGFGVNSNLTLPDSGAIDECGQPVGDPLEDPAQAVRAALTAPLGYPPLRQVVVPGDHIVLAIGEGLVDPNSLVAGTVLELLTAGIEPQDITILRHSEDARLIRDPPIRDLPSDLHAHVRVEVHDASDRERICLLNVSSHDEPIYLNRSLVDADVVIPLGMIRTRGALGRLNPHATLYPAFADQAAQQRYLAPRTSLSWQSQERRRQDAAEADWLLGTRLFVQVVPGAGERLLHVLAGEFDQVDPRGRALCDAAWTCHAPRRASLVIAPIPGGRQQQTWGNVARALAAALRLVTDQGTIAVCCDLRTRPGPSLRRLARSSSLDVARKAIQSDQTTDALAAMQLIEAMQQANVYLLSRLDEECIQSLGLAYVASADEVVRLASRHESCMVLHNAHQAAPTVATESVP